MFFIDLLTTQRYNRKCTLIKKIILLKEKFSKIIRQMKIRSFIFMGFQTENGLFQIISTFINCLPCNS